jgi:RNA-binding protein
MAPVVLIGAEGVSPGVVKAVSVALEDHELIKARLGQGFVGDRFEAAAALAEASGAAVVQVIGRVIALYRRRCADQPKRARINLPS